MNMKSIAKAAAPVLFLFLTCALASAQAQRTWVSGVGDDANPCTRAHPCRNFAGALPKTATGGEIDVLDPGGFGAVTITKSISIEGCCNAGVLVVGTNAIVINAPAGSNVVLRGLTLDGQGSGIAGIKFVSGGSLHVEDCTINNFVDAGIDFSPSTPANLIVTDTKIRNCFGPLSVSGGIDIHPGGGGSAIAVIDNVRAEANQFGFKVEDNGTVTIRNSIAGDSAGDGFVVISNTGAPAVLTLEDSLAANNVTNGIRAQNAGAVARIGGNVLSGNANGFNISGGQIFTTGDNRILDAANTGTLQPVTPQQ
jgi:hypothetical protein